MNNLTYLYLFFKLSLTHATNCIREFGGQIKEQSESRCFGLSATVCPADGGETGAPEETHTDTELNTEKPTVTGSRGHDLLAVGK